MDYGMSSYSQFNSSPTNPLASEYVTTSQVYTARATGWVNFVAVGGGGGAKGFWGAFRWGINFGEQLYNNGAGSAGAAGGLAIKSIYVTAGTSYTITIGAGGAGMTHYSGFNTNGRAGSGSVTSVVGPGISLVVTGGQGGGSSGSIALNAVGGSVANATNVTYDYYSTGGNAVGATTGGTGGSSVGIFGNGKTSDNGYGAGTGGGSTLNSNSPPNGYPNEIGRNYTRQLAGGIATTSNYCETTSVTAANSGVLSNCGGGGLTVSQSVQYGSANATGGRGAVFAGGGGGYAYSQNYNGNDDPNGQSWSANGTGAAGGYGGGGGTGYGYKWWATYSDNPLVDPGIYASGTGGAGGQGLVIVEYL